MTKHAFLSASSAHRWTRCEAAPWREKDLPDVSSPYAEEGTRAHRMLEHILEESVEDRYYQSAIDRAYSFDSEMAQYISNVAGRVLSEVQSGTLYTEQQLDISFITDEPEATGTADVVIASNADIVVVDLKYGMGVRVDAEDNEQLMIYGAAALEKFDLLGEIETVTLAIDQPRLDHVSKWTIPADELRKKIIPIREVAKRILAAKGGDSLSATPGAVQCKFCKARSTCPEYRSASLTVVVNDFVDLDKEDRFLKNVENAALRLPASDDRHLATCMDAVDMIENWCKAVRGEIEKRLLDGTFTDPRYKLVQGKRGHRKWRDVEGLMAVAKSAGVLDEIVERTLRTPAQVEKIHKGTKFWDYAKDQIIQSEGKPSVAPAKDKRNTLQIGDSFTNLDNEEPEFIDALIGLTKEGD